MECIWKVGIVCNESIVNLPFFYWLLSGFSMVFLEFFIPGVFIIFLGLGAIFTGIVLFFIPIGLGFQIIIWVVSSSLIILSASQFIKNLFPSTQSFSESANKDDYIGKEVIVVDKVEPNSLTGRVQLQGTEWKAISLSHVLEVGDKGRVYDRDNLTLIIEKI